MSHKIFGALIAFLVLASPSTSLAETLDVNGETRSYEIFIPPGTPEHAPALFVLHGGGLDDSTTVRRMSKIDELAQKHNIIAVYPDGKDKRWNDGRQDENGKPLADNGADDIAFFKTLQDYLAQNRIIDPAQTYVAGFSNGGLMAQRLACEVPERLAGIAVIAANTPSYFPCPKASPLTAIFFNGTDDKWMPFEGGEIMPGLAGRDRGQVLSAAETAERWRSRNGCQATQAVETDWADINPADGTRVRTVTYKDCLYPAPVAQIIVKGGGHVWPGMEQGLISRKLLGPGTRDIDGNETLWHFLRNGRLPPLHLQIS